MRELKYSEILKINNKFEKTKTKKKFNVALVSNITVDVLKEIFEYSLRSKGITNAKVQVGNFNNIIQDSSRIKKSDVKHIKSYSLTPNSPEPDTNWRDNKNISTSIKPLVDGVKPPKMPKKRKDGIVKWLKTITGIEVDDKKTTKKKPRRNVRKKNTSPRKNTNQKKGFQPKKKPNKNFKNDKKEVKKPQSKPTPKPSAKKPINKKSSNVKKNQGMPNKNNVKVEAETPKAKSAIKEIVKKKKVKKELPLRAKNDPRQKN